MLYRWGELGSIFKILRHIHKSILYFLNVRILGIILNLHTEVHIADLAGQYKYIITSTRTVLR